MQIGNIGTACTSRSPLSIAIYDTHFYQYYIRYQLSLFNMSINIEDMSAAMQQLLAHVFKPQKYDVLFVLETHTGKEK